jgi:hypothetical protein
VTLEEIRQRLVNFAITNAELAGARVSLASKGKWGRFNELLLGLAPSNSPLPDLGEDGELKTTTKDLQGRFRESVKICMVGQDPIKKLQKMVLVVARDLNASTNFHEREVRNEEVVLLAPSAFLMHVLRRDREILGQSTPVDAPYFLETRTAGGASSSTRAFYLKQGRVEEYVNRVRLASEFALIRERLLGRVVTVGQMAERGYGPSNKGRFGVYVNSLVRGDLGITVRTTAVRGGIEFVEDLLVCRQSADPVAALDRMILVCMRRMDPDAPPEREDREIVDVVYLAPPRIAVHALRRDVELLDRRRTTGTTEDLPMFLTLKSHGRKAGTTISYYIYRAALADYVRLLQNQPL